MIKCTVRGKFKANQCSITSSCRKEIPRTTTIKSRKALKTKELLKHTLSSQFRRNQKEIIWALRWVQYRSRPQPLLVSLKWRTLQRPIELSITVISGPLLMPTSQLMKAGPWLIDSAVLTSSSSLTSYGRKPGCRLTLLGRWCRNARRSWLTRGTQCFRGISRCSNVLGGPETLRTSSSVRL